MTLASLREVILADAAKEGARLEAAARRESEKIRVDGERLAADLTAELTETARQNMEIDQKRRLAAAQLGARDKLIAAKQSLIDTVFSLAADRLDELDDEAYINLAARLVAANTTGGEEIIFDEETSPPATKEEILTRANRALAADGKTPVAMAPETRKIGRGFISRRQKVELDGSFASLIDRAREGAEVEVAQILFSDQTA